MEVVLVGTNKDWEWIADHHRACAVVSSRDLQYVRPTKQKKKRKNFDPPPPSSSSSLLTCHHCSREELDGLLQMNRLSLRNNQLRLETSGELPPIISEESTEDYISNEWKHQNRKMYVNM